MNGRTDGFEGLDDLHRALDDGTEMLAALISLAVSQEVPPVRLLEAAGDAIDRMAAACRRHGKFCGVGGVYDEALMAEYVGKGARLILSGSDLAFLVAGARSRSSMLRSIALTDRLAAVG